MDTFQNRESRVCMLIISKMKEMYLKVHLHRQSVVNNNLIGLKHRTIEIHYG